MPNRSVERHRQCEPNATPRECFLHLDLVRLALKYAQIQRQHRSNKYKETDPCPCGHRVGKSKWQRENHGVTRMVNGSFAEQAGSYRVENVRIRSTNVSTLFFDTQASATYFRSL